MGEKAGSASVLMQSQAHGLARFLLFGCLPEPGFHRIPWNRAVAGGRQHTKACLLGGQFRQKVIPRAGLRRPGLRDTRKRYQVSSPKGGARLEEGD